MNFLRPQSARDRRRLALSEGLVGTLMLWLAIRNAEDPATSRLALGLCLLFYAYAAYLLLYRRKDKGSNSSH